MNIAPPSSLSDDLIVVVGAGMGGLAAALSLSAQGYAVTLVEKAASAGGKMRQVQMRDRAINAGPTVFTMRWVFDRLMALCQTELDHVIKTRKAEVLARHGWRDGSQLDLFADIERSADAIATVSDAQNAEGYRRFCADGQRVFGMLQQTYIEDERANPLELMRRIGFENIPAMVGLKAHMSFEKALRGYFTDPRLVQLFGRYATYCGSSPYLAPATLMLVSHVEQAGVHLVEGGMAGLAKAFAALAVRQGVNVHYGKGVSKIATEGRAISGVYLDDDTFMRAKAVVYNGDVGAIGQLMGFERALPKAAAAEKRSLSAMTYAFEAKADGFPLAHHTVLFGDDYRAEFEDIFKRAKLPKMPTTYLCAPDRADDGELLHDGQSTSGERLFCLVNAPANGDIKSYSDQEVQACLNETLAHMETCGLTLTMTQEPVLAASPDMFNSLFPMSGGALYGPANHGMMGSFNRAGNRTKIKGLYLAGGSVHPGPGVPMAALSGMQAAANLISDHVLTPRFRPVATSGGMSMA